MLAVTHLAGFGAIPAGAVATFDPAATDSDITLSGGNLSGSATTGPGGTRSTAAVTGGKFYSEILITSVGSSNAARQRLGVALPSWDYTTAPGNGDSWVQFVSGNKRGQDAESSYGASFAAGDVLGIALDRDAGRLWFAKNNVWQASGDPAAGTNPAFDDPDLIGSVYLIVGMFGAITGTFAWTWRPKAADQSYAAPSGFTADWPG